MEIAMYIETSYPLYWAWGYFVRGAGHTKPSCCLFEVCGSLRDLRKVRSGAEEAARVEKSLEATWVRCVYIL